MHCVLPDGRTRLLTPARRIQARRAGIAPCRFLCPPVTWDGRRLALHGCEWAPATAIRPQNSTPESAIADSPPPAGDKCAASGMSSSAHGSAPRGGTGAPHISLWPSGSCVPRRRGRIKNLTKRRVCRFAFLCHWNYPVFSDSGVGLFFESNCASTSRGDRYPIELWRRFRL